ncbi:MAG: MFS transporter [Oscillospiraceae bacterium]|nr:MFS transporter [Oscillospiraceae bacterium]
MQNKLWTKDFTTITLGSVVSMMGNSIAGFAMSLFVLDYMESTLLYAIYIFLYTLPQIAAPVISGPLMDRFSRRRTIYTLDFCSTFMYLALGALIFLDAFNFGVFAAATFVIGTINSVYMVAFESFYPMLITEGNYSKAYSISGTLQTMTFFMLPLATLAYNAFGLAPLLIVNSVFFLIAAICETKISDVEAGKKLSQVSSYNTKAYFSDMKDGIKYLVSEKGLFAVTVYFMVISFVGGASQVITLPWFKASFENGEYLYMFVSIFSVIGRSLGGLIHYKVQLPAQKKFGIALFVYVSIALVEAFYLYAPLAIMQLGSFIIGILGVTSYNIRVSATQSHVPDHLKGRFNGAFFMLNTVGTLSGELLSGVLSEFIPMRATLMVFMLFSAVSALIIIGGNKKHIAPIYNRNV